MVVENYNPEYTKTFEQNVRDLISITDKKTKGILTKDISFILQKPYFKSKPVINCSENNLRRKHVCSGKFRIFYVIKSDKVIFYFLRVKDKNTYKF